MPNRNLQNLLLLLAVSVPVVYFGAQVLGAIYFPDFSVLEHVASILGSDLSTRPQIFNAAVVVVGLVACLGSWGLYAGLRASRIPVWLALVSALCMLSFGLASFWAAAFPLPDPRHNPGPLSLGMFVGPFAALICAYKLPESRTLRWFCLLMVVGFFVVASIYSGYIAVDRAAFSGLVQRIGALVMLTPLSAVSWWLLRNQPDSEKAAA